MSEKIERVEIKHNDEILKLDISKFKGREAFKILFLLKKKVAPSLAGAADLFSGSNISDALKKDIDVSKILKSLLEIFETIGDDDDAFKLAQRLLVGVTVYNGEKILYLQKESDFDEFFMERAELVYLIIFEVLKINYPFFQKAINSMSGFLSKTQKTSGQPKQEESKEKSQVQLVKSENSEKNLKVSGRSGGSSILEKVEALQSQSN